jgi:hypothetical protein
MITLRTVTSDIIHKSLFPPKVDRYMLGAGRGKLLVAREDRRIVATFYGADMAELNVRLRPHHVGGGRTHRPRMRKITRTFRGFKLQVGGVAVAWANPGTDDLDSEVTPCIMEGTVMHGASSVRGQQTDRLRMVQSNR